MLLKTVLLLSLAAAPVAASAQTVYRCGNSYGSQPCAGATAIDVTDRSTPEAAARATRAAAEDMRRAEAMEKARLQAEKDAPKAVVIGPKEAASAAAEPAGKERKKDAKKGPEVFTASGPKKK
ncbi:hypothetical protein H8N03_24985 [Ramlibacter sp. USB13]|uniref:DUF4124 domain-containing protein n=1 Tax=Ramlibacter cellulosilyticus TaxID=2764187 RepID=A0A923MWA0_9BURK|nr:hypothetical protein [Ramlibacter cellulosilyticus]MBC5786216.1 hypothetical protein [Ramlibacter cellulosilyticus]